MKTKKVIIWYAHHKLNGLLVW